MDTILLRKGKAEENGERECNSNLTQVTYLYVELNTQITHFQEC